MKLTGNQCLCRGCDAYFKSVAAFDKHRVGSMDNRRCLDDVEMLSLGMAKNDSGFWVTRAWDAKAAALSVAAG